MKNAFIWKGLFVLKIFTFFSWLFVHVGKPFDKKAKVNFKIYDVTDWEANNKHILSNISRRKDNQSMRFDHLI